MVERNGGAAATVSEDRLEVEPADTAFEASAEQSADLVESELLIEDVSIDGMCGVY